MGAIGVDALGKDFFFRGDRFDPLTCRGKVPNVFKSDFSRNGLGEKYRWGTELGLGGLACWFFPGVYQWLHRVALICPAGADV
jgi:hypothetical protein